MTTILTRLQKRFTLFGENTEKNKKSGKDVDILFKLAIQHGQNGAEYYREAIAILSTLDKNDPQVLRWVPELRRITGRATHNLGLLSHELATAITAETFDQLKTKFPEFHRYYQENNFNAVEAHQQVSATAS